MNKTYVYLHHDGMEIFFQIICFQKKNATVPYAMKMIHSSMPVMMRKALENC